MSLQIIEQREHGQIDQLKENIIPQKQAIQQNLFSNIEKKKIDANKYFRFINYPISNKAFKIMFSVQGQSQQEVNIQNQFRQPNFNIQKRNKKALFKQHSILNYLQKLFHFVRSVQFSSITSILPQKLRKQTFESKYKFISLAILNNSINLQASVIKALQYNIPLMQIIINSQNKQQQQNVVQKIIKCFNISLFINQNFILYIDWQYQNYQQFFTYDKQNTDQDIKQIFGEQNKSGKIVFRKGKDVFAEISLEILNIIDEHQMGQKLTQIRDHYYRMKPLQCAFSGLKTEQKQQLKKQQKQQQNNQEKQQKKVDNNKLNSIQEQLLQDYLLSQQNNRQQQLAEQEEEAQEGGNFIGIEIENQNQIYRFQF